MGPDTLIRPTTASALRREKLVEYMVPRFVRPVRVEDSCTVSVPVTVRSPWMVWLIINF
jgi:hypothetical protein